MSEFDIPGLHDFLTSTPEQGLRKMLIDPKLFSEAHFNLLLKVVRGCDQKSFCEHLEKNDFPKVKMNANDLKLKETFWSQLIGICKSRGLLNPAQKPAA